MQGIEFRENIPIHHAYTVHLKANDCIKKNFFMILMKEILKILLCKENKLLLVPFSFKDQTVKDLVHIHRVQCNTIFSLFVLQNKCIHCCHKPKHFGIYIQLSSQSQHFASSEKTSNESGRKLSRIVNSVWKKVVRKQRTSHFFVCIRAVLFSAPLRLAE